MTTNTEYALLAAYANSPMPDSGQPENSLTEHTGGQPAANFILPAGWTSTLITLDNIEAARPGTHLAALSTFDLAGMAAFVFTKGSETVIAFRGTQMDEGLILGPGRDDAIADWGLGHGDVTQQVSAAYWFYQAALALPSVIGTTISFTGHSLGGALASIMANYTGRSAVVFDPAPNVATAANLRDGALPVVDTSSINPIIFPVIPPSPFPAGSVTSIVSAGDPLNIAFGDAGGGQLGAEILLPLNFDRDVFADNRLEFVTDSDASLHSIHLVALQQETPRLGAVSFKLLDLMTQVFNDDVNLRYQIGKSLGILNHADARYDLFLRNMLRDQISGSHQIINAWLTDLEDLGSAQGRLQAAGKGSEPGIKDTFEWTVMRSLIQASIQLAAQDSIDGTAHGGIITKPADVITVDLGVIKNVPDGTATDGRFLEARSTLVPLLDPIMADANVTHLKYLAVDAGGVAKTTLTGSDKVSLLAAFDGDDTLNAGTGATWFYGGDGKDTASMAAYALGVTVVLGPAASNGWAAVSQPTGFYGAIHYSVENVIGTAFDDRITGNDVANKLQGGTGGDTLSGGGGVDTLDGGGLTATEIAQGKTDTLTGGDDRDSFIVSDKSVITDLQAGERVTFAGKTLGTVIEKNDSGAFVRDGLTYAYAGGVLTVSGAAGSIQITGESGALGPHELWKVGDITGRDKDDDSNSDIHDKIDKPHGGAGGLLDTAGLDKSSPLVFDLDGDGIELVSRTASTAFFDVDQDGLSERVGWVKADDGLLVWDKNSNGKIDDSSELFGTKTTDGYTVLRALDSNSDGSMSSLDANWGNLRLWRDANQNGIAEASELKTLATTGITSISLAPTAVNYQLAGNTISHEASFVIGGVTRKSVDAWFSYDNFTSTYRGPIVPDASVTALPNLTGHGDLPDLRIAMMQNAALKTAVAHFTTLPLSDWTVLRQEAATILQLWGGNASPSWQAPFEIPTDADGYAFLNKYFGVTDVKPLVSPEDSQAAWRMLADALMARLVAPKVAALLPGLTVNLDQGPLMGAINFAALSAAAPADVTAARTYWLGLKDALALYGLAQDTSPDSLNDELATAILGTGKTLYQLGLIGNDDFTPLTATVGVAAPGWFYGGSGNDLLTADNNANNIEGRMGDDTISGNGGNDVIDAGPGWDIVSGGDGNDSLGGGGGNDILSGDGGDDYLGGGVGDDLLMGGAGNDNIDGEDGDDLLDGGEGNDTLYGGNGMDTLVGGSGDDTLDGWFGHDRLEGGSGNDTLFGGADNDDLLGGSGDDTLNGSAGLDRLDGGDGNDLLIGEGNADVYVLSAGIDTIQESGRLQGGENHQDTILVWEGVSLAQLTMTRVGTNLVLAHPNGVDTTTIIDQFRSNFDVNGIDFLQFSDGTKLSLSIYGILSKGGASDDTLDGHAIDDEIYGYAGNDIIHGFGSSDYLYGGDGNDTIDGGDGDDTIYGDAGNDLINGGTGNDYIMAGNGDDIVSGGDGNDRIFSDSGSDSLSGGAGDDTLQAYGTSGLAILRGDAGDDDLLTAGGTSSISGDFDGGAGNDKMQGTSAQDIYRLSAGFDTITEPYPSDAAAPVQDRVVLWAGVTASNVVFERTSVSAYMIKNLLTGDYTTVRAGANPVGIDRLIEEFQFSDGTVLSIRDVTMVSNGTAGNDVIDYVPRFYDGRGPHEYLKGLAGNDTLTAYASGSILDGGAGDDYLTANSTSYFIGGSGNDTISSNSSYGTSSTIDYSYATGRLFINTGYAAISDGGITLPTFQATVRSADASLTLLETDTFISPPEQVLGTAQADVFAAPGRTIYLPVSFVGGAGNDRFLTGARPDYSTDPGRVLINRGSTAAVLDGVTVAAGTARDGYGGIDTLLDSDNADGMGYLTITYGSAFSDWMRGGTIQDTFYGMNGNDVLEGGAGNDTLDGGAGTDTLDYSGSTATVLVNLSAVSQTLNATVVAAGTARDGLGGTDTLTSMENVTGSAYADWMFGSMNADKFDGGAGNDTLNSDAGNDTLIGGAGNDILAGGSDYDVLDYRSSTAGILANLDSASQTLNSVIVAAGTVRDGLGGTDTVSGIESVIGTSFADWMIGGSGAETFVGGAGNDNLNGGAGVDRADYSSSTSGVLVNLGTTSQPLNSVVVAASTASDGLGGLDTLTSIERVQGSAYADWMVGSANADTFAGGKGNDNLNGGAGTDTLDYSGSTATVLVNLSTASQTLNATAVAAGTARDGLGGTDTLASMENVTGSASADWMFGSVNADKFDGGAGNDTLNGDAGNDTLIGGADNDTLIGGAGYDSLDYRSSTAAILVNLDTVSRTLNGTAVAAGTVRDGLGGTDTVSGIESVYGSAYADWMTGGSDAETFVGGAGNDNLNGGGGIDRADYSTSTAGIRVNLDSVSQTLNAVAVAASTASDGFGGLDTLTSIERVQGSAYADWMIGGAAADTFAGGAGNDNLNGGAGIDTLDYSGSTAGVLVNLSTASQTLNATVVAAGTARDGLGGTDTLLNLENITGSAYNDFLYGNVAANLFDSGAGNDWLFGGAGADTFLTRAGGGTDTVADYLDGTDKLRLVGTGATSFASLTLADTAGGATVSYGGQTLFILTGIAKSALDSGDFLFL